MKNLTPTMVSRINKKFFGLLVFLFISLSAFAQSNIGINATGLPPNPAAGLDVDFSDKGLLIPRVSLSSTLSFTPLVSHVAGMIVYNTATIGDVVPGFYYNDGTKWIQGFLQGTAVGDMLYWNGGQWTMIPVGLPGQFLQISTSNIPEWGLGCNPASATIITTPASAITGISASSGGNITSDGGSAVLTRGVCWSVSGGPTIADSKTTDGAGIGIFTSSLTGLTPVTTYHIRAYTINSAVVSYGNEVTFTTSAILPTLAATTAASAITGNTANSGGNVLTDGGSPILERGICYGTTANPTTANTKIIDGTASIGSFISNLTGLTGYTTYYVRAYATNSVGTAYGTQISFTTTVVPPTLITTIATSISGASAASGGTMSWNGGGYSNYQNYGVAYSTVSGSTTPTYVITNGLNGSVNPAIPIPPWTTNITGLAANTTYYIRAYLNLYKSGTGWVTIFGNELMFTTTDPTAPIVASTNAATLITASTVRTGGVITSDGGSAITVKGVCWDVLPNPTKGASNFTTDGTGSASFVSNLTGLTGNTNYYVRAYATNALGTSYAPVDMVFTTSPSSPYALMENVGYGIVGYIAADGSGFIVSPNIPYTGGWGCSGVNVPGIGTAIGTGQSNTDIIIANCGTSTAAGVARAYTGGGFNDWYLPSSSEWGQIALHFTWYGIAGGHYYTSSQYMTNYNYAATFFNTGSSGTCYGSGALRVNGTFMGNGVLAIRNFAASPAVAPTIAATTAITGITATSAISGGIIASGGGSPITAKGVCWSTTSSPTIADSKTFDGTGTGTFTSNITGLTTGTPYYVRAYATNSVGTSYGPEVTFTPVASGFPNVTTASITNLAATTATSGGNVTNDGGATVTERGVCWSTITEPTIADSKTIDGSGMGVFVSNVTGLTTGTTYYLRAYATNVNGTTYGAEFSMTPFTFATLTTDAVTNIAATSATSGGNITSDGSSAVTARGICWSTATAPTTADFTLADIPGTGIGAFVSNLTGLTNGTPYYVRAYATNGAGTAYGNEVSFTTSSPIAPTINTEPVTAQTTVSCTSGGTIVGDGGDSITISGICWNTTGLPTTADNLTTDGTTSGTFYSDATGLTAGITYYIRAYATNGIGTSYGNEITFTPIPPSAPVITTDPIYNLVGALAEGGGVLVSDGGSPITAWGLCWSETANPTTSSNTVSDTFFLVNFGTNFYASMTGLTVGTTYHVRAYATNSAATSYGNDVTFTATAATLGQFVNNGWIWGVVFSVDGTGTHGLIADPWGFGTSDWGCLGNLTGASGTTVGTGLSNTLAVIADINDPTTGCAGTSVNGAFGVEMCQQWIDPNWYLPSKDEVDLLWNNRVSSGMSADIEAAAAVNPIWSSSEVDANNVWYFDATLAIPAWVNTGAKNATYFIWPIRSF